MLAVGQNVRGNFSMWSFYTGRCGLPHGVATASTKFYGPASSRYKASPTFEQRGQEDRASVRRRKIPLENNREDLPSRQKGEDQ